MTQRNLVPRVTDQGEVGTTEKRWLKGNIKNLTVENLITKGPWVDVRAFGAVGDGVTDDAIGINLAIASGAKNILIPSPPLRWTLLSPINLTSDAGTATNCGVTLDFRCSSDINAYPNGSQPILIKHTGHGIDMSGSRDCRIIGLNAEGDSATTPKTLIFSARNSAGSDCGRHRLYDVRCSGKFSVSPIYFYGTEETYFFAPFLVNAHPGKATVIATCSNIANQSSSFITIATGAQSTTVLRFIGGQYHSQGNSGNTNEVVFNFDSAGDVTVRDAFLYCPYGLAHFYVGSVTGSSDIFSITGCRCEPGDNVPTYGIYFADGTARTHANWFVEANRWSSHEDAIYAADTQTLNNLTFVSNTAPSGKAINVKLMDDSALSLSSSIAIGRAGGTVQRCVFTGWNVNISLLGASLNNQFIDTYTGTVSTNGIAFNSTQAASSNPNTLDDYEEGTWTPEMLLGGSATGITYAARKGVYTKIGNVISFSMEVVPLLSGNSSGALSISLPFVTANNGSASTFVVRASYVTVSAQLVGYAGYNSASAFIKNMASGVDGALISGTDIVSGCSIALSGHYQV